ncbi:MAG: hypothetical protein KC503_22690 [Myxococcales bacterium]|nr:hypothetical protein [Myxococcales bacterium]
MTILLAACSSSDGTPVADGGGSDSDGTQSTCAAPTGGPTMHQGHITADETWTAATGPHIVTFSFGVQKGATLTIEPCSEVRLAADHGIDVAGPNTPDTGTLVAEGTADRPIRFVADQPGKPWAGLLVRQGGSARLAYVTLEGGGSDAARNGAALAILGDQSQPAPQELVHVDHVTISGADTHGVSIEGHGAFTADSKELVISGAGSYPVRAWPNGLGTLPSGSYTGNAVDEILMPGGGGAENIAVDMTLHDRGVPYRVGLVTSNAPELRVSAAPATTVATLTIEAGVHIRFGKGGMFAIEFATGTNPATGAVVAEGTASAPIVFTSAERTPAAGDWVGLRFGLKPDARNKLDHVRVEYAGGQTGIDNFSCDNPARPSSSAGRNEAAILILGEPAGAFVTNSTIADSAGDGIERGWSGPPIDFLATNTFQNVAYCKQSYPLPQSGACPSPVPCER